MAPSPTNFDSVRSSHGGHDFHKRWAARRALQLIFPSDRLHAMAVEGLSPTETTNPGQEAEDVADLVLYYGEGDNFSTCDRLETIQFKYKEKDTAVSASYLKKTMEKFAFSLVGYQRDSSREEVEAKVFFSFVTNADFSPDLWKAIDCLKEGNRPVDPAVSRAFDYLVDVCKSGGLKEATRLFAKTEFRAGTKSLPAQSNLLRRALTDWSSGADGPARGRLSDLQDLIGRKAGPSGKQNNLVKREDVLDALACEPDDLFPAGPRFLPVGEVVDRAELESVTRLLSSSYAPIMVHAEGGVGKTVFVQSVARKLENTFEVVVFDCFGGGAYRSEMDARHLPKFGFVQIANELASRGLCDPLLPTDSDRVGLLKAARKRFSQAVSAIEAQSEKKGVLIVVDAADNAQIEADARGEDCFVKMLLSSLDSDPLPGVKLLMTARTHRMDNIVGRAQVDLVQLAPFSVPEIQTFLATRRDPIWNVEFATAVSRSQGNARVLDYLVATWDANIKRGSGKPEITVREIIKQRCDDIFGELLKKGWPDSEVREFFAAISLLPPPIPLDELATALGWSKDHVLSAASDLAPMLELVSHGAIFRDEPTETYIRETYSEDADARRQIADRLHGAQSDSDYAAEALPYLLVLMRDAERAYALAASTNFPKTIYSDFGRRRLQLARLHAAFQLAVASSDMDHVLDLTMRLAQVSAANARGDQFIRRSPALAVMLGDRDAYRRLFNDRAGWRGARDARLTVAHCFAGEPEEAAIHCDRTIGWLNWHHHDDEDDLPTIGSSPDISDFAAVMFLNAINGEYGLIDRNLCNWDLRFAFNASVEVVKLIGQFERHTGRSTITPLVAFAVSEECKSFAMKVALLNEPGMLNSAEIKSLTRAAGDAAVAISVKPDNSFDQSVNLLEMYVARAALAALLHGSKSSAKRIMSAIPDMRPSGYDYGERYGYSRIGRPVLCSVLGAWTSGSPLSFHHLIPRELKVTRRARAISDTKELATFLKDQTQPVQPAPGAKRAKGKPRRRYSDHDCDQICSGIELILALVKPIEKYVLAGAGMDDDCLNDFVAAWTFRLRLDRHPQAQASTDLIGRTVGLALLKMILRCAAGISETAAEPLLDLVSNPRFGIAQKIDFLDILARRPALHDLAGRFALRLRDDVLRDEYIEQRGEQYSLLAIALIPMSIGEAREYYRQGLSQLDQMGGDDHDEIYSLLRYVAKQSGGSVRPDLGHRLMNLCQTIIHDEPSKFGWPLYACALANSVGLSAIAKLIRWDDQDVADFSYGLPQLVCELARLRVLDPRRAAVLLTVCEDHGWRDWKVGEGLADLLEDAEAPDRSLIFAVVFEKLKAEYSFGAPRSLWKGLLDLATKFPDALTSDQLGELHPLLAEAERDRDEYNSRHGFSHTADATVKNGDGPDLVEVFLAGLVRDCASASAVSIDTSLRRIRETKGLAYSATNRFLEMLSAACPYESRGKLLFALCESSELDFGDTAELLIKCLDSWSSSSSQLHSAKTAFVERMFEFKGSELFDLRHTSIGIHIRRLGDFLGDQKFVVELALRTVAHERLELNGDEWLEVATAICLHASATANRASLEQFLSAPALRIAEGIGEGTFRPEFAVTGDESALFADVLWKLLADDDAYIRWTAARSVSALVDLGLMTDLRQLLERFDVAELPAMASPEYPLSFQNSRQWLLMGLARAALRHGTQLKELEPSLYALVNRDDVHAAHKLHALRCLQNISGAAPQPQLLEFRSALFNPPKGYTPLEGYAGGKSEAEFGFDYEFAKTEVPHLAQLFGVSHGKAADAIVDEIRKKWPEAENLGFFPGRDRYLQRDDRYEFFREHVQKHALIGAATALSKTLPVVRYGSDEPGPWIEWLRQYDVTFEDGSWLSDHKDPVPPAAKRNLLATGGSTRDTLLDMDGIMSRLGFSEPGLDLPVVLFGSGMSPDLVHVTISSALAKRQGAVGECERLSKKTNNHLLLPQFWDQGYFDKNLRQQSPFEPLIWVPHSYGLGIDEGDKIAACGPHARPRLGIDITRELEIASGNRGKEWRTGDGKLALRSQVWGRWEPNPDERSYQRHNDGSILFTEPDWLDAALSKWRRRLVYTVTFWKYASPSDYDRRAGIRAKYVGLRNDDGTTRIWHAKRASKLEPM